MLCVTAETLLLSYGSVLEWLYVYMYSGFKLFE